MITITKLDAVRPTVVGECGGCARWLCMPQPCSPQPCSPAYRLQVKPLEGSLQNVNGRGCNESAAAGAAARGACGVLGGAVCVWGLQGQLVGLNWKHPPRQNPYLSPFSPPTTHPCYTESGRSVAKEQYCDPAEYYLGQHAACFAAIRHHYEADAGALQYGPTESDAAGMVAVAR